MGMLPNCGQKNLQRMNRSFLTTTLIWLVYLGSTGFLVYSSRIKSDIRIPYNSEIFAIVLCTISLLFRQSQISIRHASTPDEISDKWIKENTEVDLDKEMLLYAWRHVSPRRILDEIDCQMHILNIGGTQFEQSFKVLSPVYP